MSAGYCHYHKIHTSSPFFLFSDCALDSFLRFAGTGGRSSSSSSSSSSSPFAAACWEANAAARLAFASCRIWLALMLWDLACQLRYMPIWGREHTARKSVNADCLHWISICALRKEAHLRSSNLAYCSLRSCWRNCWGICRLGRGRSTGERTSGRPGKH
jgi:hypothetical protein